MRKKFFFVFVLGGINLMLIAQNDHYNKGFYIIPNDNFSILDINQHETALLKADMENYRYKSTPDTLEFTSGLKFILFSAKELFISGKQININNYSEKIESYIMPKFLLSPDGTLLAIYTHKEK